MSLGKLLKQIAPIAISAFAGPAIGASFGASPFVSRALTGALTSKLMGGRSKDALRNALLAGVSGAAFDKFSGADQAVTGPDQTIVRGGSSQPPPSNPDIAKRICVQYLWA